MSWKIYLIRTSDEKIYVGCTSQNLKRRINGHRHLKKDFVLKEHSLETVYETESEEEAHKFEAYLISKYDSTNPEKGYNRHFGGSKYGFPKYIDHSNKTPRVGESNAMFGRKHSEETKEKIRQKALSRDPSTFDKVRQKTPEQIRKLHEGRDRFYENNAHPLKGKTHSAETRKKISEAAKGRQTFLGKRHSPETIEKMRASQKRWRELKTK